MRDPLRVFEHRGGLGASLDAATWVTAREEQALGPALRWTRTTVGFCNHMRIIRRDKPSHRGDVQGPRSGSDLILMDQRLHLLIQGDSSLHTPFQRSSRHAVPVANARRREVRG